MPGFTFFGYICPVKDQTVEQQEACCKVIAHALDGSVEGFVIEQHPDTQETLKSFIDGGRVLADGRRSSFRGSTLLVPTLPSILGSGELCRLLHLRFMEVGVVTDMYPHHSDVDFQDRFWHHVNNIHTRIRARAFSD